MSNLRDDTRIVKHIRVVVHAMGPWPNGMSDNHWSIYLLLAGGGSVRMNMRAAKLGEPEGRLDWSSLSYTLTTSAITKWDYATVPGITVKNIYGLVMDRGRDKYNMSGGGSGCRYWVYVIIKDLEKGHLALKTAGNDIWPKLLFQYSPSVSPKPLPMIQGEFTSGSSKGTTSGSTSSTSSVAAASSASASAKSPVTSRTAVQVKSYTAGGQLCYSWNINGVEDRSYAKEWTSVMGVNGIPGLLHKGKNLVSALPH